jgi:type VI secretion system protein ImpB
VRSPRVQITYDVEIGNAIEMKELPFVMGILSDLSGNPVEPLPKLKFRKFVEIDRDSFNDIMGSINPRLTVRVANKIDPNNEHLSAELFFGSPESFEPLNVAKQVPALAKFYEARTFLKNLATKLDGNDHLDELLHGVMKDPAQLETLKGLLGIQLNADASASTATTPPSGGGEPTPS